MSRLVDCGAEMNNATDGGILDSSDLTSSAVSAIGGLRGFQVKVTGAAGTKIGEKQFAVAGSTNDAYLRFNMRPVTAPSTLTEILKMDDAGGGGGMSLRWNTDRTLELWDETAAARIGSPSAALALATAYRIEVGYIDSTRALTAYIDGTSFATGTLTPVGQHLTLFDIGIGLVTTATGEYDLDDIAVNDQNGTEDTGLPGEGYFWPLLATSDGDTHNGTRGGTDSGSDWGQVAENPPDDVTSYYILDANSEMIEVNLEAASVALANQSIRHVAPIARHRASVVAAVIHNLGIKSQSGGTVQSGSSITHNDTSWKTNGDALPRLLSLVSYTDPQAGGAWTPALLDGAQLRLIVTDVAAKARWVTGLYALVEYWPGPDARYTQAVAEVLRTGVPPARYTQAAAEVLRLSTSGFARYTQAAVEVLRLATADATGAQQTAVVIGT